MSVLRLAFRPSRAPGMTHVSFLSRFSRMMVQCGDEFA